MQTFVYKTTRSSTELDKLTAPCQPNGTIGCDPASVRTAVMGRHDDDDDNDDEEEEEEEEIVTHMRRVSIYPCVQRHSKKRKLSPCRKKAA
jgi:hypothetical protein